MHLHRHVVAEAAGELVGRCTQVVNRDAVSTNPPEVRRACRSFVISVSTTSRTSSARHRHTSSVGVLSVLISTLVITLCTCNEQGRWAV
jgi:hypothetical protein